MLYIKTVSDMLSLTFTQKTSGDNTQLPPNLKNRNYEVFKIF